MRLAKRSGIETFEANLIIAAVQHERRKENAAAGAERNGPRRLPLLAPILLAFAVEFVLVFGAWRVCCG
jgi:hypothetical protein